MFVLLLSKEKKSSFFCSYFLFFFSSSSSFVLVYCFPSCLFLLRPRTQSTQLLIMSLSLSLSLPSIFLRIYCYKTNTIKVEAIHIRLFLGYYCRCILLPIIFNNNKNKSNNILLCASARTYIHLIYMFSNVML